MRATAALIATVAAAALVPSTAAAQTPPAPSAPCANADVQPTTNLTAAAAGLATVCLVNQQRAAAGLKALKPQLNLAIVAQRYAQQMGTQKFFDHVSPSGSTLSTRIAVTPYLKGARAWGLAENIAWGQGTLSTPNEIVRSWMGSPGHRRNILDGSLREIGVGVVPATPVAGVDGGATYVHDFGRRR
jgi:uncharacterized protein YkwD